MPGGTAAGIQGWGSREGPSGLAGDPHLILVILAGALGAASGLGLVEISLTCTICWESWSCRAAQEGQSKARSPKMVLVTVPSANGRAANACAGSDEDL